MINLDNNTITLKELVNQQKEASSASASNRKVYTSRK